MEDKLNFQLGHLWLILKQNHLAMVVRNTRHQFFGTNRMEVDG